MYERDPIRDSEEDGDHPHTVPVPQSISDKMNDRSFSMPNGQEEQVEDGWIRVGRGKGKPPVYMHGINPPIRDMTVEKIRADFDSKMRRWRASSCRKQAQQILDRQRPDEGWQIGDAVCLATGSFSRDNWQNKQRSVAQFVAFVDIVRYLQSTQSTQISCYAQEPEYTPLDKNFLASMGITALDYDFGSDSLSLGAAAQHLNTSSFAYEPFMDLGVDSMRELFGAEVRLYIGSSMKRWVDDSKKTDTEIRQDLKALFELHGDEISARNVQQHRLQSRQASKFVQSRQSYRFPMFEEDPNVFEGLTIYWKEPQDEDEDQDKWSS